MERRLLALTRALRDAGLAVSPAEAADAAEALLAVGVGDRNDLRAALASSLVKDPHYRPDFDDLFDRHFPAGIARPRKKAKGKGVEAGEGTGDGGRGKGEGGKPGETEGEGRKTGEREREKRGDEGRKRGEKGEGGRGKEEARKTGGREGERRRRAAEVRRVLRKSFREVWTREEEAAAAEAMEELARRIATRLSRRRRRARRGALDLRHTLRANLGTGGVPFRMVRRSRRPGRRDLTILADVSGSVRRAARLFLLVIARLRGRSTGVRAFAYVDRPAPVPAAAFRDPLDGIIAALADRGELDPFALSDHGEALRRFRRDHARAVTGRTVLLILGDARNNRFPAQEWELEGLARKAAAVWWIVPEEERLWGTGDSAIGAYAASCDAIVAAPTPAAMIVAAHGLTRAWRR